jgi:hypothetical protein
MSAYGAADGTIAAHYEDPNGKLGTPRSKSSSQIGYAFRSEAAMAFVIGIAVTGLAPGSAQVHSDARRSAGLSAGVG